MRRRRLRATITLLAAAAIVGGLIRLALDDRVTQLAMPEPEAPAQQGDVDEPAPLLSRAITTMAVDSRRRR